MAVKTLEERVTLVEHKVAENARGIDGLRDAIAELGTRMDRRFDAIDQRFEGVDQRFQGVDQRFQAMDEKIDQRFQAMDEKMDRRFDGLQQQQTSNFRWSVGLLATAVLTIIASVAAGTSAIVAAVIGR